jgi:3D (Asp-Asp-Asp) domain-containing protein
MDRAGSLRLSFSLVILLSLTPMRARRAALSAGLVGLACAVTLGATSCTTKSGAEWVRSGTDDRRVDPAAANDWRSSGGEGTGAAPPGASPAAGYPSDAVPGDGNDAPLVLRSDGRPAPGAAPSSELFRNTYYDFPREGGGPKDATVYDASCAPIASVPRAFHDQVCVQGSGRLASGATVSFAKRGCSCAAVCPRTGQQICFEQLDPVKFPSGRGATGKAVTPLRTVAVDTTVIPLGTVIFIPDYVGLPGPDGAQHDGCFLAEDRGIKVVGRQIDVFTGDPAMTARWNAMVPSNQGVRVRVDDPRCKARLKLP